jgi:hypothetical protein
MLFFDVVKKCRISADASISKNVRGLTLDSRAELDNESTVCSNRGSVEL